MKNIFLCLSALFILFFISKTIESNNMRKQHTKEDFVFATYASDYSQVRHALQLIKGIHCNAGEYNQCEIYVGIPDNPGFNFDMLKLEGVKFINFELPEEAKNYYYAAKAYAAAEIEKSLGANVKILAWFDPETIVTGSVIDLDLKQGYLAAIRPVYLFNKIGIKPEEEADEYWGAMLDYLNLKAEDMPIVETEFDLIKTRAYYNCGIFSINPALGIMQEWAKVQTVFLKDKEYQKKNCSDILRKIFFHQVVFSCVVTSKLNQSDIYHIPMSCGYALLLHERMPDNKRINRLNDLSCAIVEDLWDKNPEWLNNFTVEDPLKTWLQHATQEYLSTEE
jgi:hypothetical protein